MASTSTFLRFNSSGNLIIGTAAQPSTIVVKDGGRKYAVEIEKWIKSSTFAAHDVAIDYYGTQYVKSFLEDHWVKRENQARALDRIKPEYLRQPKDDNEDEPLLLLIEE